MVADGGADEDIKSVLPPFDALSHSGSRVNITAGVAGTPLSDTFLQWYDSYQQVNVDEGYFGFKARCYNPNKPWKWHLEAFCLSVPITGYLIRYLRVED